MGSDPLGDELFWEILSPSSRTTCRDWYLEGPIESGSILLISSGRSWLAIEFPEGGHMADAVLI